MSEIKGSDILNAMDSTIVDSYNFKGMTEREKRLFAYGLKIGAECAEFIPAGNSPSCFNAQLEISNAFKANKSLNAKYWKKKIQEMLDKSVNL